MAVSGTAPDMIQTKRIICIKRLNLHRRVIKDSLPIIFFRLRTLAANFSAAPSHTRFPSAGHLPFYGIDYI